MQAEMHMSLADKSCTAIVLIQPGFKPISWVFFISMQDLGISRVNMWSMGLFSLIFDFDFGV